MTVPVPRPGVGEVLIAVSAAGVNRPDILQRRGLYAPPPGASVLPGLEVAGVVVAHGDPATAVLLPRGTRVCALLAGGGYAPYAVAPAGQVLVLPDAVSDIDAAAIPETLFTVYQNLWGRGGYQPSDSLLIHGGTSGIGTMALSVIRYARARAGASPDLPLMVTCGTPEKCARALDLGASHAVNYRADDFVAAVAAATGGRGVDIVLDMVGGDYVPGNLACLAAGGRHISIATQGGATASLDLRLLMQKSLVLTGGTLRPRTVAEKTALRDAILRDLWPGVVSGAVRPVIHAVYDLAEAAKAHQAIEVGEVVGKVVLLVHA